jgi:methionine-rich copper-binding protein CopC
MKKAFASIIAVLALTSTAFAGSVSHAKVDVKAPASAKKGEKATTKIHIEGTGGFHYNTEYPTKLTITAPSGVTVEKATQTAKDAVSLKKEGADLAVNFTATETGKKSFTGELKFAVCTDNNCEPSTQKISFDVDVQ